MRAGIALLGSLTIPGLPEQVAAARAFVARTLGDDYPPTDTAVLLTSELVTNSLQHSHSGRDGGTITVTVITIPNGIRVEVLDEGGATTPAVRPERSEAPDLADGGRGLQLVELLSDRWNCWRDADGTVTWFELT